jgi:tRNA threonylcarbamoyladenosine biosynthesis protein TsaE
MVEFTYTKNQVSKVYQYILEKASVSSVIFLHGEIGTGKTFLVSEFLKSQGVEELITSPTFPIVKEYFLPKLKLKLFHYDLYRIKKPQELMYIDIDDNISDGMLLIEWPEIAREFGIKPTLEISIKYNSDDEERLCCVSY